MFSRPGCGRDHSDGDIKVYCSLGSFDFNRFAFRSKILWNVDIRHFSSADITEDFFRHRLYLMLLVPCWCRFRKICSCRLSFSLTCDFLSLEQPRSFEKYTCAVVNSHYFLFRHFMILCHLRSMSNEGSNCY